MARSFLSPCISLAITGIGVESRKLGVGKPFAECAGEPLLRGQDAQAVEQATTHWLKMDIFTAFHRQGMSLVSSDDAPNTGR